MTVSFSVARFTVASATPGTLCTTRPTLAAQLAQSMPNTGKVAVTSATL